MNVQSLKKNSHLNSAALQHAAKEVLNEPLQSSSVSDYSQVDQRENQTAALPLVIIQYYYSNLLQVLWKYKVIIVQAAGLPCWAQPKAQCSPPKAHQLQPLCLPASQLPPLPQILTTSLLCHYSLLWAVLNSLLSCSLKPLCSQHRLNPVLFKLLSRRCPCCSSSWGKNCWALVSFSMQEGNLHLEILDGGGLASFFQSLVYPADYNVIVGFLTITQVLEDIQRVPENQQREQD